VYASDVERLKPMLPKIENLSHYTRNDGVLIACLTNGAHVPLVKFYRKFPDLEVVNPTALQYMKDFMQINPNLWWNVEKEEVPGQQITLF